MKSLYVGLGVAAFISTTWASVLVYTQATQPTMPCPTLPPVAREELPATQPGTAVPEYIKQASAGTQKQKAAAENSAFLEKMLDEQAAERRHQEVLDAVNSKKIP